MELHNISIFLKDTIPGVIILGAIGSLLAIFILWLVKKAFNKILKNMFSDVIRRTLKRLFQPIANDQVQLLIKNDKYIAHSYYSYQLSKFVVYLFIFSWSLQFFINAINISSDGLLRPPVYIPMLTSFLSAYWAFKTFLKISLPYIYDVGGMTEQEYNKAIEDKKNSLEKG